MVPGGGRRVLRRELRELADARSRIADVATVDLAATGGLVVEGADETTAAMARSVVLQLVTLIGPDELGLRGGHLGRPGTGLVRHELAPPPPRRLPTQVLGRR